MSVNRTSDRGTKSDATTIAAVGLDQKRVSLHLGSWYSNRSLRGAYPLGPLPDDCGPLRLIFTCPVYRQYVQRMADSAPWRSLVIARKEEAAPAPNAAAPDPVSPHIAKIEHAASAPTLRQRNYTWGRVDEKSLPSRCASMRNLRRRDENPRWRFIRPM